MLLKVIQHQYENEILLLTINRPEALNALNQSVFDDLEFIFTTFIPNEPNLRGVILTGSGQKAFVAGADIKEFKNYTSEELQNLSIRGQEVFNNIEQCKVPVLAAVNGFALGGGCELAMACHLRFCSENAKFGQPEVNLGLIPGYGATQRLPQIIGKGRALELLLTADIIDAEIALSYGLVTKIFSQNNLISGCFDFFDKIKTKAPIALAKIIACVNTFYLHTQDGFSFESSEFGSCSNTYDFKEGTTAFEEKRKPIFTNS